jgi:hypothetical protein
MRNPFESFERRTVGPSPEEIERSKHEERVKRVSTLLNPDKDALPLLRSRLKEFFYEGKNEEDERRKNVQKYGYNPEILKGIGEELFRKIDELTRKAIEGKKLSEEERLIFNLVNSHFERAGRDTSALKFDEDFLSLGLEYEVMRQGRKLVKSSMESDPREQREVLKQHSVEVSSREIEEFIKMLRGPGQGSERLRSILDQIQDPDKRRQYVSVLKMLRGEIRE